MTLNFEKSGDVWVSEATVTGDYLLHLERKGSGLFRLRQRAGDGLAWADCVIGPYLSTNTGQVLEWAFSHGVYPDGGLQIRIESGSEVTNGTLSQGAGE